MNSCRSRLRFSREWFPIDGCSCSRRSQNRTKDGDCGRPGMMHTIEEGYALRKTRAHLYLFHLSISHRRILLLKLDYFQQVPTILTPKPPLSLLHHFSDVQSTTTKGIVSTGKFSFHSLFRLSRAAIQGHGRERRRIRENNQTSSHFSGNSGLGSMYDQRNLDIVENIIHDCRSIETLSDSDCWYDNTPPLVKTPRDHH